MKGLPWICKALEYSLQHKREKIKQSCCLIDWVLFLKVSDCYRQESSFNPWDFHLTWRLKYQKKHALYLGTKNSIYIRQRKPSEIPRIFPGFKWGIVLFKDLFFFYM